MSLARGLFSLGRASVALRKVSQGGYCLQSVRNSGGRYSYRCGAYPPTKFQIVGAEVLMGIMWWWILWHLWHEHEHITGEFEWPDPKKWTDAELGIPPK